MSGEQVAGIIVAAIVVGVAGLLILMAWLFPPKPSEWQDRDYFWEYGRCKKCHWPHHRRRDHATKEGVYKMRCCNCHKTTIHEPSTDEPDTQEA